MLYSYPADYDPATIASAANTVISQFFKNYTNIESNQSYFSRSTDSKWIPILRHQFKEYKRLLSFTLSLFQKSLIVLAVSVIDVYESLT